MINKKVCAGVCAILLLTIGCNGKGNKQQDKMNLQTTVVGKGEITVKLEETGEIQPISEIDIKSKVSGKIIKYLVEEGDEIKKGQIIAEIEPDYQESASIANIKSSLNNAEINLKNARKTFEDNTALLEEKFISQKEFDDSKDALSRAEISYNIALQQYELTKEIETDGNIARVYSTADGTVIQILVEEGEMVQSDGGSYSSGTVLLQIADLRQMIVNAAINEVDISKLKKNQRAEIKVDAYPYETYNGVVTKINVKAVVQNNVKVFPIEIKLTDINEKLKPGMTANITLIGEEKKDILLLPIRAIFADESGNDIVYKVTNDSISGSVEIKTGINNFQEVEIIEGVAENDTISLTEPVKNFGKGKGKKKK
jgi:HlyD family secretion protein